MNNCYTPCNCGCHEPSHCTCNHQQTLVPGYITGELLGTNRMALIQNGRPIGEFPITSASGSVDILDAFGDVIPNS